MGNCAVKMGGGFFSLIVAGAWCCGCTSATTALAFCKGLRTRLVRLLTGGDGDGDKEEAVPLRDRGATAVPVPPPAASSVPELRIDIPDLRAPPPAASSTCITVPEIVHIEDRLPPPLAAASSTEIRALAAAVVQASVARQVPPQEAPPEAGLQKHSDEKGEDGSISKAQSTEPQPPPVHEGVGAVSKSRPADSPSGFPAPYGRLQIIKNCDLEEVREIGCGTFGTVFHAKWRGTDVAVKRLNRQYFSGKLDEQENRADFLNEASKLSNLHHPNILTFYGVVPDGPGGSIATMTEYMVNGSLRRALAKNPKTLDWRKRVLVAMDVAFGMEYLQSKNIVHFDLKCDNLLVNLRDRNRPVCKVGDLGLSKIRYRTLISGDVRGTLPWMAPELLNGSNAQVSEKVDVFSFGIVLWEILTGEVPYGDLQYGLVIGGIVSNTLRPKVPDSCCPEWRSLMEQCWSTEPSDRPSFTEVVTRLRSIAATL